MKLFKNLFERRDPAPRADAREAENRKAIDELRELMLPNVTCSGCDRTYAVGHDAIAFAAELANGLVDKTIKISGSTVPEDLIVSCEVSSKDKGAAILSWRMIQRSLYGGQRRTWRCKACNEVNEWEDPLHVNL